ncbi:MAG: trypsin-like peptidase domain-containing protein [Dehalococcoidales bacterium]|nr:trypsin-like peptidase domain-containing protein [Dehalococcoidales bacterium]
MTTKLLIIILAALVLMAGGSGYFTYTLTNQVDRLESQLAIYQEEQASALDAISAELDDVRDDTRVGIGVIEGELDETREAIDAIAAGVDVLENRLTATEGDIGAIAGQVGQIDERLIRTEAGVTGAVINASKIYDTVARATVRITNGTATAGSGFIYDASGRVITAYHVVEALSPIYVIMFDGRISRATISGFSELSDVAVLLLDDNPNITPVPLADSSLAKVGDPVVALGSPGDSDKPLGLRDTLTAGIISQVNRNELIEDNSVANLLQFDAPVNFGNSGCALFDARGEIIGLVIARIDASIGDGIYWAVSSNKVSKVADSIIATGSFPYPWIGVGIQELTPLLVEQMSLETANGVLVGSVFPSSPALTAGFRVDDIIITLDGIPVRNIDELVSFLAELYLPGDTVVIDVLRGASTVPLTVIVGER